MTEPSTPSRRSGRLKREPVLALSSPSNKPSSDAVPSGLLHSRPSQPHDFLSDETTPLAIDDPDLYQTRFYQSFTVSSTRPPVRPPVRTYGKSSRPKRTDADAPTVFNVGDVVYIRTMNPAPSIGVIIGIWTVQGNDIPEKAPLRVRIHWFVRPSELPKHRVPRDFCENEVLYNIDTSSTLPASSIISTCTISSSSSIAIPAHKPKDVQPDVFFCRSAVDPARGLYYEHHWDSFRDAALRALSEQGETSKAGATWPNDEVWNIAPAPVVRKKTRHGDARAKTRGSPRKRRRIAHDSDTEEEEDSGDSGDEFHASASDDDEEEEELEADAHASSDEESVAVSEPKTPSRKRKRGLPVPRTPRTPKTPRTPRRPRVTDKLSLAQPTPHSKAALRRRKKTALAVRPPPPAEGTLELALARGLKGDAWERAMHVLHVAARPGALPCREEEYGRVLRAVEELLEEGSGGCIYISGVPGTGKTATVHAVVRELKRMAEQNEANPFAYVEINGLKIPEPAAAYGLLWEAVCGHDTAKDGHMKVSSKEALRNLSKHFSGAERVGPAGGHACVVLMDELDQLMTTKQDVVYNFFNWPTLARSKLVVLAVANTMDLPERVMTGRVRSRLGMVRINFSPYTTPQLEQIVKARLAASKLGLSPAETQDVLAPDALRFAAMKVSSISGDARRVLDICRRTVELVHAPRKRMARADDVKAVIREMQNSPTAAYVRELGFHERIMLAALVKCVRKEGVEEIRWEEVQRQHFVYLNLLANDSKEDPGPTRRPSLDELTLVLDSLLASHALICEDGAAIARKAEGERRVALNLEYAEVERVLGEVGGQRWRNALNV